MIYGDICVICVDILVYKGRKETLNTKLRKGTLKFYEHIYRMVAERLSKKVLTFITTLKIISNGLAKTMRDFSDLQQN